MGGIDLSSGKNCTVGRLVANPWASQQHDGGRVVEIGANRQSCDPAVMLLLKLLLEVVSNHVDWLRCSNAQHLERSNP
jgi:hypothetical protein